MRPVERGEAPLNKKTEKPLKFRHLPAHDPILLKESAGIVLIAKYSFGLELP